MCRCYCFQFPTFNGVVCVLLRNSSSSLLPALWSSSALAAVSSSYTGLLFQHQSVPGVVESLKIVTRANSNRIAKFAFDYAMKHGRKKVTAVHKANIMWDWWFLSVLASYSCSIDVTNGPSSRRMPYLYLYLYPQGGLRPALICADVPLRIYSLTHSPSAEAFSPSWPNAQPRRNQKVR